MCAVGRQSFVVHADGSTTMALTQDMSGAVTVRLKLWIGHFSADGHLDSQNSDVPAGTVALALDSSDTALLAVGRRIGDVDKTSLYTIRDGSKPVLLFKTERDALANIAVDGGDVLVSGFYNGTPSGDDPIRPELTRYRRDGTLVWRQSSLRIHDDSELTPKITGTYVPNTTPFAVDSRGHAIIVDGEYRGSSVAEVDRHGNVLWATDGGDVFNHPDVTPLPELVLDGEERPLLAGALGDGSAYIIERARLARNPPSFIGFDSVQPNTDALPYQVPFVGLASDEQHRILLAAIEGTFEKPRVVIHRYSADLTQRESFAVPEMEDFVYEIISDPPGFQSGIRAGQKGDVYLWTSSQLGRIALPESSGSALPVTASTPPAPNN
jgi:hypothetical protein